MKRNSEYNGGGEKTEGFELPYVLYLIVLAGVLTLVSWRLGFLDNYGELLGSILGLLIGVSVLTVLIRFKIIGRAGSVSSYLKWSDLSWKRRIAGHIVMLGSIFLGLGAVYGWRLVLARIGPVPWPIRLATGLPIFFGVMVAFMFLLFRTVIFPER